MITILRSVAAVVLGLLAGGMIVAGCEAVSGALYNPDHVTPEDPEAFAAFIAGAPPMMFLLLLAGWSIGIPVGAAVATLVAGVGRFWHGLGVTLIFLAATIGNLVAFAHPIWVALVGVTLPTAAALWASGGVARLFAASDAEHPKPRG